MEIPKTPETAKSPVQTPNASPIAASTVEPLKNPAKVLASSEPKPKSKSPKKLLPKTRDIDIVDDDHTSKIPDVVIEVTLNQSDGTIIDFAQLCDNKYGWEALHPGQTAAGDVLEDDDDDESENEEKPQQQAGQGANSNGSNRRRADKRYDLADPFIDDSEVQWEERAVSTQDGFFVYAGPLVTDQVDEQAAPTKKRKKVSETPSSSAGATKKSKVGSEAKAATKRKYIRKKPTDEEDKKPEETGSGSGSGTGSIVKTECQNDTQAVSSKKKNTNDSDSNNEVKSSSDPSQKKSKPKQPSKKKTESSKPELVKQPAVSEPTAPVAVEPTHTKEIVVETGTEAETQTPKQPSEQEANMATKSPNTKTTPPSALPISALISD
ncbi:hypothetical protein CANCADRAFT_43707 [Tortispora caseinolytica NRRL Y-17796]|uniref:Hpc2-related domain-containing protein n=1 Tax=Tortispora caseinolytica NRRL Y-17796 TaxID=767744 RepID=A0A1E4TE49_9ASCO|nr:hypothetical protein CANCADRAFT_43707 [Tortispora caseinolytica NRRL Y-17796]